MAEPLWTASWATVNRSRSWPQPEQGKAMADTKALTELEYTYGYYRELAPGILRLACLNAGVAPPAARPLRYLELAYGQGVSINIHAAAITGEFWGTDFNATQASHARALAEVSGSGATLLDDSFVEFAARPDVPEFDMIGLHGIWAWTSDENRRVIVDVIRRKLRVGGILYLSYNCLPGWALSLPLRHLMNLHADVAAGATGMLAELDGAIGFIQRIIDSGAVHFRINPVIEKRLKAMSKQNRNYLAHEYFASDFCPMSFSDVVKWLDGAKVSFVASAGLSNDLDRINMTAEGQKLLGEIGHPMLRESVRDYLVNQQFRRDVFVKGPRRLTALDKQEALRSVAFSLMVHPDEISMKIKTPVGEAALEERVCRPIITELAENDYAPKTYEQIAGRGELKSLSFYEVMQALLMLTGSRQLFPAQNSENNSRANCRALNNYLLQRARTRDEISYLASPVTGAGVAVPRFHQLFLLAMQQGKKSAAEQADFAWKLAHGQRLFKGGRRLESADENIAELNDLAGRFATKRLPILKALEVV
jgi:SAM-dependent methyltransferase